MRVAKDGKSLAGEALLCLSLPMFSSFNTMVVTRPLYMLEYKEIEKWVEVGTFHGHEVVTGGVLKYVDAHHRGIDCNTPATCI